MDNLRWILKRKHLQTYTYALYEFAFETWSYTIEVSKKIDSYVDNK